MADLTLVWTSQPHITVADIQVGRMAASRIVEFHSIDYQFVEIRNPTILLLFALRIENDKLTHIVGNIHCQILDIDIRPTPFRQFRTSIWGTFQIAR